MNSFKITILLSTYNRAHLIEKTLDSISNQTYENWECFITDDNSTDNTTEIVLNYIKKDSRFQYFNKTRDYKQGLSGNRNFGLDLVREKGASFIQFFDDDDLMYPKKLELQIKPFIDKPNLNFTVCKYDKIIKNGLGRPTIIRDRQELNHEHLGDSILTGEFRMNSLSGLWNFKFLDRYRFDERLSYAEEWELFTRIGYEFPNNYAIVNEYLYAYRKHPDSLTMSEDLNYERRKTSHVIRLILVSYLTKNKLHTKKSILFFTRNFLTYQYNPKIVFGLLDYVKSSKEFPNRLTWYLTVSLFLSKSHFRILGKISTWI